MPLVHLCLREYGCKCQRWFMSLMAWLSAKDECSCVGLIRDFAIP